MQPRRQLPLLSRADHEGAEVLWEQGKGKGEGKEQSKGVAD